MQPVRSTNIAAMDESGSQKQNTTRACKVLSTKQRVMIVAYWPAQ